MDGFERFAGLSYSSASILALELDYVATLDQYSYCEVSELHPTSLSCSNYSHKLHLQEIINISLSCSDILTPNLGRLTAYQCLQWKFESNEGNTSYFVDKIHALTQLQIKFPRLHKCSWNG